MYFGASDDVAPQNTGQFQNIGSNTGQNETASITTNQQQQLPASLSRQNQKFSTSQSRLVMANKTGCQSTFSRKDPYATVATADQQSTILYSSKQTQKGHASQAHTQLQLGGSRPRTQEINSGRLTYAARKRRNGANGQALGVGKPPVM